MAYTPRQLSDLQCIRDVITRYTRGIDRLDADLLRSVYWPDATDDHGPEFKGRGWDYVEVAMASHRRWRPSLHTLLNQTIELDPDGQGARAETYCVAYLFDTERPVLHQWFGRYLDRLEQREGEWRIADRVCVHEASRLDDPVVAMPFDTDAFRQGSFDRPSPGRPVGP